MGEPGAAGTARALVTTWMRGSDMETVQECFRCKRVLPLDAFSPSARGQRGVWCRECHRAYLRGRKYGPRRNRVCVDCSSPMFSTLPPDRDAVCAACRRRRAAERKKRRDAPKVRACGLCKREAPLGRKFYCSDFCRIVGKRLGNLKSFVQVTGEFQRATRWWLREYADDVWLAGPPPHPVDVWVTPAGVWLCPFCAGRLRRDRDDELTRECEWCAIKVTTAPQPQAR